MVNILIANPKGGSGKTTLSTNLAGYFARNGDTVTLRDLDRQQSATRWVERRSSELPVIHSQHLKKNLQLIQTGLLPIHLLVCERKNFLMLLSKQIV